MAQTALAALVRYLRSLPNPAAEHSDRELLRHFVRRGEEEAFTALVRRHASLVWSVCRRLLDNDQDAEDAFQAVFLVLLHKAASLHVGPSLANWLHVVATRIAQKSRVSILRRRLRETRVETPRSCDPFAAVEGRDLRELLDEELDRLPEKYRAPLVLCYLEGMSYSEAAQRLGWRDGTVCGRLARARELLRQRLTRRGLTLSGATLVTALTESSSAPATTVTAALRMSVLFTLGQPAMNAVSPPIATLAHGALQAMSVARVKAAVALVLVLGLFATGAGWTTYWVMAEKPASTQPGAQAPKVEPAPPARKDYYGDPLPPYVVARMGSVRLRHMRAHVVFAADGKTLISAGPDRRVCFWDVATGRLLRDKRVRSLPDHGFLNFGDATLSPNRKLLAINHAINDRGTVYLYDVGTGEECGRFAADIPSGTSHISFSADGKMLALWPSMPRGELQLWDVPTAKKRWTLKHLSWVGAFGLSADGKLLASTSNALLHFWDTSTGKALGNVRCEARSLTFSPDGKLLAAGDNEGAVTLWEAATRNKQATLKPAPDISGGYFSGDRGITFSPDGSLLAVAGNEALVLWDVATQKELRRLPDRGARSLAFAPDGKTLACASEIEIRLWDVARGRLLHPRPGHDDRVASMAVSPDGKILASVDWERSLRLWNAATGKPLDWQPTGRFRGVVSTFSPDGKWFIGAGDGAVQFWEAATGKEGRRFAIEDLRGRKRKHELWGLALSTDGQRLTAFSTDDTGFQLSVWDMRTGQSLARRPYRARAPVYSPVLTPDGAAVLVQKLESRMDPRLDSDGPSPVTLEDTATGQPLLSIPRKLGHPMIFSPDGKLLTAGVHGTSAREPGYVVKSVSIMETATAQEVLRIEGPLEPLVFSPDGRLLASLDAVGDGGLRIWDVATGNQLFRRAWPDDAAHHPGWSPAQSLAFFPDGRKLATGMIDGTVLVWDLAPETWPKTEIAAHLDRRQLDALWTDLSGDARKAHLALYTLAASPKQALPFLAEHLHPVAPIDSQRVDKLLADLDSEQFAVRDAAARKLEEMGPQIEPALRRVLARKPSLEVRNRVRAIQEKHRGVPPAATLHVLRTIRVLEQIGTAEARDLLRKLASGATAARETQEAEKALERLHRAIRSEPRTQRSGVSAKR